MKNIIQTHNILTRFTLAMGLAGLGLLSSTALAQEKGAERLMNLMRPPAAPMIPAAGLTTVPMSCPKCQDVVTQVPDRSAKGAQLLLAEGSATVSVVQHLCDGCSTTVTVVGHGKAKQQVAQHTCTTCGTASKSCCATVANGKPTLGM